MMSAEQPRSIRSAVSRLLLSLYKHALSPALHAAAPGACRFQPPCSEYAAIAVAEYGWLRGALMTLGRLLRCHPLHRGGFDPVRAKQGGTQLHPSANAVSCVPQTENR
jgi:putative membrane protein insertion efficiency factor